jgi:hypothetical protein
MKRVQAYRQIARRVVEQYASYKPANGCIDGEAIIDCEHDHYVVMRVGWDSVRRIHYPVIHLDIIDGKIWIQYDGTNRPVADELLAAGVPREDIVLGFHPEDVRRMTDFAVR